MWILLVSVTSFAAQPLPMGITEWEGRYTCAQGPTHLSLTVSRDGDELWATFAFGPHAQNPTLPSGSFRMSGALRGDMVVFEPDEWLVHPPNYVTVALRGSVQGGVLRGQVDGPGCTTFEVHRARSETPAIPIGPSHWSGSYVCRQGRTTLDLNVTQNALHELVGRFAFGPHPETPALPSGSFDLAGHLDPATGEVFLVPGAWLLQPEGWTPVSLRGRPAGDRMQGTVVVGDATVPPTDEDRASSGCTFFDVSRR